MCLGGVVGAGTPARASSNWRWPLDGLPAVTRRFDPPATPYGRGHRGVDLATVPGAAVRAAGPGVVSFAGTLAGRGVVAVRHADGLRTTYEPVAATVPVGVRVAAGAQLGTVGGGHLGCPAAACLHWGLLRGRTYLDPLSLLGVGPVRLLPLAGAAPDSAGAARSDSRGPAGPLGGVVLVLGAVGALGPAATPDERASDERDLARQLSPAPGGPDAQARGCAWR